LKDEFGKDGCARVFFDATADALNPFSLSASTAAEPTVIIATAHQYNNVLGYAASRPNYLGGTGLIYPNKSSVVRQMMKGVRTTAASGQFLTLDLAIGQGLVTEAFSFSRGECR
jgi:hypothetical protein